MDKLKRKRIAAFSIHFTTKTQTVQQIRGKLLKWQLDNPDLLHLHPVWVKPIMHHCFMHRVLVEHLGYDTELVDFLDSIEAVNVTHYPMKGDMVVAQPESLFAARVKMIEHIIDFKGSCIFIGDIVEGVQTEYDLAIKLNANIIHIR